MMSISGFTPVNQVRLTNVAYVRLNKSGHRFEIACYRNKVVNWRNKIETDLNEVLQIQNIFANVAQGKLASKADMMDAFGTTDGQIICAEILEKGDLQVTELERQALMEGMFRDVATIVSEKSVNPETDRPYTISMIQNAMKDIHYSVNLTKNAKQQALDVIRKLRKVMPIARVMMSLKITLAGRYCDQMREFLSQKSANILKDTARESSQDSSTNNSPGTFEVTIDPEHYRAIQEQLNLITNGNGLLEILHQSSLATTPQAPRVLRDGEEESAVPEEEGKSSTKISSSSSASNREKSLKKKEKISLLPELEGSVEVVGDDEEEVIGMIASKSKGKNKKKAKQQRQQHQESLPNEIPTVGSDEDDEIEEEFSSLPAPPSSSSSVPPPLPSSKKDKQNKNKIGKKSKRIEKEKQKEIEGREKEREVKLNQLHEAAAANNSNADEVTKELSEVKIAAVAQEETSSTTPASGKCNTCMISFPSPADQRVHYRSDWHRINLKRKMKKLPLATSEIEFQSYPIDHWDVDIVSSST